MSRQWEASGRTGASTAGVPLLGSFLFTVASLANKAFTFWIRVSVNVV